MSFNSIFYSQAFLVKIIPCCLLTTFISLLIKQLVLIKRNNKRLLVTEKKPKTEMLKVSVANNNSRSNGKRVISYEEGLKLADNFGSKFFECSTKDGVNIDESLIELCG